MHQGILVTVLIGLLGTLLSKLPVWPFKTNGGQHPFDPIVISILLGILVGNLYRITGAFGHGIHISVKKLLPLGIIFLGARLNFRDLLIVGIKGVALSAVEVVFALALFGYLGSRLKIEKRMGLLLSVGAAICGGTAIVAVAPVIKAKTSEVVTAVATVTFLGLTSMLLMPFIAVLLELEPKIYGIWAGLVIHQTPQVIAAGFAYGDTAGETATVIKLARVCLLAPVVLAIGLYWMKTGEEGGCEATKWRNLLRIFPRFVIGFLIMALAETTGVLPNATLVWENNMIMGDLLEFHFSFQKLCLLVANLCLAVSMAGVGLESNFGGLKKIGLKPLLLAGIGTLIIGVLGLGAAFLAT